jgi:hypothetical protein
MTGPSRRAQYVQRLLALLPAFVVIVLGTALICSVLTIKNPALSPWDEDAHLDYLVKIDQFHLPAADDVMDQQALRFASCRGFYGPYQPAAPCSQEGWIDPASYAFAGNSRAWTHPPLYYAITRAVMAPVQLVGRGIDFVDLARVVSSLWTGVALFLLWCVFRRARVDPWVAGCVIAILMTSQVVLERALSVSNDATALFAGALLLTLVVYRRGSTALFLAGLAVMLLKSQNSIGIAAAAVAVLVGLGEAVDRRRGVETADGLRPRIGRAAALFAGLVGGYLVWRFAQQSGNVSAVDTAGSVVTFSGVPSLHDVVDLMFQNLQAFSLPLRDMTPYLPTFTHAFYVSYTEFVVNLVFVGAAVGSLLIYRETRAGFAASTSALVGVLIAPMGLIVGIGLTISVWAVWPTRYGGSAIPFLALALALSISNGFGRLVMFCIAAASIATLVAAILTTP